MKILKSLAGHTPHAVHARNSVVLPTPYVGVVVHGHLEGWAAVTLLVMGIFGWEKRSSSLLVGVPVVRFLPFRLYPLHGFSCLSGHRLLLGHKRLCFPVSALFCQYKEIGSFVNLVKQAPKNGNYNKDSHINI